MDNSTFEMALLTIEHNRKQHPPWHAQRSTAPQEMTHHHQLSTLTTSLQMILTHHTFPQSHSFLPLSTQLPDPTLPSLTPASHTSAGADMSRRLHSASRGAGRRPMLAAVRPTSPSASCQIAKPPVLGPRGLRSVVVVVVLVLWGLLVVVVVPDVPSAGRTLLAKLLSSRTWCAGGGGGVLGRGGVGRAGWRVSTIGWVASLEGVQSALGICASHPR